MGKKLIYLNITIILFVASVWALGILQAFGVFIIYKYISPRIFDPLTFSTPFIIIIPGALSCYFGYFHKDNSHESKSSRNYHRIIMYSSLFLLVVIGAVLTALFNMPFFAK